MPPTLCELPKIWNVVVSQSAAGCVPNPCSLGTILTVKLTELCSLQSFIFRHFITNLLFPYVKWVANFTRPFYTAGSFFPIHFLELQFASVQNLHFALFTIICHGLRVNVEWQILLRLLHLPGHVSEGMREKLGICLWKWSIGLSTVPILLLRRIQ